jgi:hypothetical protein
LYDPFYRNQQRYQQYFQRQQAKQNEIYSRHFQEYEIPNQTKKAKMAADDLLMHVQQVQASAQISEQQKLQQF